jgi:hypothetical protein
VVSGKIVVALLVGSGVGEGDALAEGDAVAVGREVGDAVDEGLEVGDAVDVGPEVGVAVGCEVAPGLPAGAAGTEPTEFPPPPPHALRTHAASAATRNKRDFTHLG